MKITLFTSNKNRHNYLINLFSNICDELFVVQECGTIFPGIIPGHYPASETMKKYFENVNAAQNKLFGNSYVNSFNKNISINLEVALRKTFTDHLDDVGGLYPDEDEILRYDPANGNVVISLSDRSTDQSTGVDNRQRSSSRSKDDYMIFGIALTYTFHKNRPCPPVYN